MELEYLTAREPFSALSCAVTARLVVMAKELDGATRAALEAQAKKHFRIVYGEGAYEELNPGLTAAS